MAKYDLEKLLNDIETILKANLNTKLAAIDTEKADSITLATVDSTAYVRQSLNGETVNSDPFIFYGVDEIETVEGLGFGTNAKYSITVMLILADMNADLDIANRMFRYLRAIQEVFQENWNETDNGVKLFISSLAPIAVTDMDTNATYRAIGVKLEATLA